MSLPLAQVCDLDCVTTAKPLVLDLAPTERYVTGQRAVTQRIVVGWVTDADLLDLEGRSWAPIDLAIYQTLLAGIAEDEDYVRSADVTVSVVDGGTLTISCSIVFIDGSTYLLEVTAADAVSVMFP